MGFPGQNREILLETATTEISSDMIKHGPLRWGTKRDKCNPAGFTAGLANYI